MRIIIFLALLILLFSYTVNAEERKINEKIHTIFIRSEGELGVDDEGTLYWNKKPVVTEEKVTLQWWLNVWIIVASVSTLAIAIVTLLQYFGITCKRELR